MKEARKMKVLVSVIVSLFLFAPTVVQAQVGMVGYWTFDEGSGTVAYDYSGNDHHLTLHDGAAWTAGAIGGALDTESGYARTPTSEQLDLGGSYSVLVWIRPRLHDPANLANVLGAHYCFTDDDGSWNLNLRAPEDPLNGFTSLSDYTRGSGMGSSYGTNGAYIGGGALNPMWGDIGYGPVPIYANEWVHVAFVYDETEQIASIYVGGQLVRQGEWISEAGGSLADFFVGTSHMTPGGTMCQQDNNYFPGDVDELAIFDEPLRHEDILGFMNNPWLTQCQGIDGTDVLYVNGNNGVNSNHLVFVTEARPMHCAILLPDAGGPGKYVVHMNPGVPGSSTVSTLPAQLGNGCFPMLLPPFGSAAPIATWNCLGKPDRVGESQYFGTPIDNPAKAPATFLDLPAGDPANLPVGSVWTFQGIILNPAGSSPKAASVTNAVVVGVL
jgi:hypothetical protein